MSKTRAAGQEAGRADEQWTLDPATPISTLLKRLACSGHEVFFGAWASDGVVHGGLFVIFDPTLDEQGAAIGEAMMDSFGVPAIGSSQSLADAVAALQRSGKRQGVTHYPHAGGHYRITITAGAEETRKAVSFYEKLFA